MRRERDTESSRSGKRAAGALPRDGERGIIIVVALLVLVSLAGVALVATHRVSLEIDRSGSFRVAKDGTAMTQAGFLAGLSLMQSQGNTLMEGARTEGLAGFSLDQDSLAGSKLFDLDDGGSFGRAIDPNEARFVTTIDVIGDVDGAIAGFSAGEFTFSKVVATTRGSFGRDNPDDPSTRLRSAEHQYRVFMLVGPQTQTQSMP